MTTGMTLEELVGCYQIFVTGGMYVKPYTYTHVTDMEGNVILEKDTTQVRVISEETATVLNRLLQTVVSHNMLEPNIQNQIKHRHRRQDRFFHRRQIRQRRAGRYRQRIGLSVSLTYYIGGVWMGYTISRRRSTTHLSNSDFVGKNLMLPIHEGLEAADFTYSENVQALQYCTESGDLATENCPSTATGWYKETYIPSSCILHRSSSTTTAEPGRRAGITAAPTSDGESGGRRVITREEQEQNQSSGSRIRAQLQRFSGNLGAASAGQCQQPGRTR